MREPTERLRDILQAIAAIQRYRHGDRAAFDRDELLQGWFLRHLQIIDEAARSLDHKTRALAPEIPWEKIVGMRNILVHGYFDIDTEIVWTTVQHDLPPLQRAVEQLLEKLQARSAKGTKPAGDVKPAAKAKKTRPKSRRRRQ